MSVLIKGMNMPRFCYVCKLGNFEVDHPFCWAVMRHIPNLCNQRPEWCPLIEVPTPHGRLIDADKLIKEYLPENKREEFKMLAQNKDAYFFTVKIANSVIEDIENAPTIIEAED